MDIYQRNKLRERLAKRLPEYKRKLYLKRTPKTKVNRKGDIINKQKKVVETEANFLHFLDAEIAAARGQQPNTSNKFFQHPVKEPKPRKKKVRAFDTPPVAEAVVIPQELHPSRFRPIEGPKRSSLGMAGARAKAYKEANGGNYLLFQRFQNNLADPDPKQWFEPDEDALDLFEQPPPPIKRTSGDPTFQITQSKNRKFVPPRK
jgi:hypothetical protein